MANRVFLDKAGVIHSVYEGKQDGLNVTQTVRQTAELIQELQAKHPGTPINLLVDLRKIGGQTLAARQVSAHALQTLPYHKIAIFGGSRFLQQVTNLVIAAAHQQDRVKQFPAKAEALAWLKAPHGQQ